VHKVLILFFKKRIISKSLATKDKNLAKLKATKLHSYYLQILNSVSVINKEKLLNLTPLLTLNQLEIF